MHAHGNCERCDAQALARLIWLLSVENKSLREALAKARQAIKDYERMATR